MEETEKTEKQLDFSDLFDMDDEPEMIAPQPYRRRLLAASPPKAKRFGFIMTLDEAIQCEAEELQMNEKKGSGIGSVSSNRLRERADLIKKFIGDYECFKQTDDPKDLEAFFIARVRACSAFINEKKELDIHEEGEGQWIVTEEEENWLNEHLQHVVRCLLRTKMPMQLTQKAWTSDFNFHNIARGRCYLDPVNELIDKMKENVHITDDHIVAFRRGVSGAKGMAAQHRYPKNHLNDWENDINSQLATLMLEPEALKIVDDPPLVSIKLEDIPYPGYGDHGDEGEPPTSSAPSYGKSILKKEPGVFYSDCDVYEMTDEERITYSSEYMKRPKKKVSFSEADPEVRLVISNHIKTLIDQHKAAMGNNSIVYPQRYTVAYVGERFASTMAISYNKYREMCWATDKNLALAQVRMSGNDAVRVPHLKPQKVKRHDVKAVIKEKDGQIKEKYETMPIPAHSYLVPRHLPPITEQNDVLESHLNSLTKFRNFWQPNINNGPKSSYNFCYGNAIISDSLLEQAFEEALDTAGIFCFPHPFDILTIYTWIDAIKPEDFSIHNIVFVWGLDRLTTDKEGQMTLAELMTLYQMVRARMDLKFDEYTSRGFTRLSKPRYWFTTLPVVDVVRGDMIRFNETMRLFIKRNNTVKGGVEPIGLLDWAQSCQKSKIPIQPESASQQLDNFYDLLKEHIGIHKRRDNDEKKRDIRMHRERLNQVEWIEKMNATKSEPLE